MCKNKQRTACRKIVKIGGKETLKNKIAYNTLDEAIIVCRIVNLYPDRTDKVAPYKCTVCHKYHIGRNGTKISEKYRKKAKRLIESDRIDALYFRNKNINLKVIGKIDLDKIK